MDKKVLIQNVTSAISSIIMSKEDRELLINVFYGIASELESTSQGITTVENKTKPATTSVAGIVKQMTNIPKLAGTEQAADICTKVNAILDGLKTATIMA